MNLFVVTATFFLLATLIFGTAVSTFSVSKIAAQNPSPPVNNGMPTNSTSNLSTEKKLPPPEPRSKLPLAAGPNPPAFSERKRIQLQQGLQETFKAPPLPMSNKTIVGPIVTQSTGVTNKTQTNQTQSNILHSSALASSSLSSPQQVKIISNHTLTPNPNSVSNVDEPSVANKGNLVFYTGNWYTARSSDGGTTWRYINPVTGMSDYCCDADVIYDPTHKIFLWYRQGVTDPNTGENRFKLGVSTDTANWSFYSIKPTDVNSTWSKLWFDYPHIALGSKYLYISSNVFDGDNFRQTILLRISLQDLKNSVAPSFSYYQDPDTNHTIFTFTPVQGANDTMYWATHLTNSKMRTYEWNESLPSTSVKKFDVDIPAWSPIVETASCPGPDTNNWCGRSDNRITSGWLSRDTIGFLWNANSGGTSVHGATFAWPYINAATFKISKNNITYAGRPYLWSPTFAWGYGYAAPDRNGNVAVEGFFGGGASKFNPSVAIGMRSPIGSAKPWNMGIVVKGSNGPADGQWGDYDRVRPLNGEGPGWIAAGYTLQGGSQQSNVEPRYFVFGLTPVNSTATTAPSSNTGVALIQSAKSENTRTIYLSQIDKLATQQIKKTWK